jgi:hypothetical protein
MSPPQSPNHQPQKETTPTDNPLQTSSTSEAAAEPPASNEDLLSKLLAAMGPVVDFHKTVEAASENDLRMYWDIRLVQGKDTPFTSMSGHSSFPGTLAGSSLGQLPAAMSREIVEKIAVPLAARLQDMTNAKALETVMKNVPVKDATAKPARKSLGTAEDPVTAESLLPAADRNEIVDMMLPPEVVREAADIISELKRNE